MRPLVPNRLSSAYRRLKEHSNRFQAYYFSFGLIIFFGGILWSVRSLEVSTAHIGIFPLVLNAIVGAPIAIAVNAVGLVISSRVLLQTISFSDAFRVTALGTAGNVLPLPTGFVLHSNALASRGASTSSAIGIVLLGQLAAIALCAIAIGALFESELGQLRYALLGLGLFLLIITSAIVFSKAGFSIAVGFVLLRAIRILVMILRLQLCFLMIGLSVGVDQSAVLAASAIVGTTLAVIPAGFGASELFAALAASSVSVSAAAAFLAVAINRITTLLVAGSLFAASYFRGRKFI
jgi:hypothetical protein